MCTIATEENPSSSFFVSDCDELWEDIETHEEWVHGEPSLVCIQYESRVRRCLHLFCALVRRHEISDRMLNLTTEIILHNSANYTAWVYRRLCIKKLKKCLKNELAFVRTWAEESPKNYQVWHHRRWVLDNVALPSDDLAISSQVFSEDPKNCPAWSHRRWMVERFGIWESELRFATAMIDKDLRNNSAWNYRFFLLTKQPSLFASDKPLGAASDLLDIYMKEIEYCMGCLLRLPTNECPYNYTRKILGLTRVSSSPGSSSASYISRRAATKSKMIAAILEATETLEHHQQFENRYLQELRAEIQPDKAVHLYDSLCALDPVRRHYWSWQSGKHRGVTSERHR